MRKLTSVILFASFPLLGSLPLTAQMIGSDIYLPGSFLEIGQNDLGALGSTGAPPAGYHPNPPGGLAMVYDYGLDGWSTGIPPYFGDYTMPVNNYEGWGLQINGSVNWALSNSVSMKGTGSLTGHNVSYSVSGSSVIADWAGTAAAGKLLINMQTKLDTSSSWVTVTVKFYNSGPAPLPNVYYVRTCNPHNDVTYSSDTATNNVISFQNDTAHRVMVSANGTVDTNAYLGLCTIDRRATAFITDDIPIDSFATDFATIWNQTFAPAYYVVGLPDNGNKTIGLVFNIATIMPADSASISYAYVFDGPASIDTAFAMPKTKPLGFTYPSITPAISISPNPTTSSFAITSTNELNSITISNLLGQKLYYNNSYRRGENIDVENFATGLYIVTVNGTEIRKLIKE